MKYLLDTNVCAHFLRGNANVVTKIAEIGEENLCISEVTLGELYYGAECSDRPEENYKSIEMFCEFMEIVPMTSAWMDFARQKAILRRQGQLIEDADIMIGATAIANDMILVTGNIKHLSRLQNIQIENW